ncbi:hypothetical protein ACFL59_03765 [Planctomycetota bacterium]
MDHTLNAGSYATWVLLLNGDAARVELGRAEPIDDALQLTTARQQTPSFLLDSVS